MIVPRSFLTRDEVRWLGLVVVSAAAVKLVEKLVEKAVERLDRAVPDPNRDEQKSEGTHGE